MLIRNSINLAKNFVVTCPSCRSPAFVYTGSIGVGKTVSLDLILGARWEEPTIPCCFSCDYHFGPTDFKENLFVNYGKFFGSKPNASFEKKVKEDLQKKYEVVGVRVPPPTPVQLDLFDSDNKAVTDYSIVWEYFRISLKEHTS